MSNKAKILVLVEGAKDDVKLMGHLFGIYGISNSHQIVSYNTNIYDLYEHMFAENNPSDIDLQQLLKEREPDPNKKAILDDYYSDKLLIFDMDPQDPRFSSDKLAQMIDYFTESSDMGKLYINYPMVEAFYHMKSIPDKEFYGYCAELKELKEHKYKSRVAEECRNKNRSKFAVNRQECNNVIKQNMEKSRIICFGYNDTACLIPESKAILEQQLKKLNDEKNVFVLCTCVFYIPEYNKKLIESESSD